MNRACLLFASSSFLTLICRGNGYASMLHTKPKWQVKQTTHMSTSSHKQSCRPRYPVGKHGAPNQVYVSDFQLLSGTLVQLSREEISHLRARRIRDGASLNLFNARGDTATAILQGDHAMITTGNETETATETQHSKPSKVHAVVAAVKSSSRSDWLVEKLTELNISSITFTDSTRACLSTHVARERLPRWTRVAIAAAKQSVRHNVPRLDALSWHKTVDQVKQSDPAFVLCAGGDSLLLPDIVQRVRRSRTALFVIGPEGGLTDIEINELVSAGARQIGLGASRLRVETASVLAAGIIGQILDLDMEEDEEGALSN